MVIPGRFLDPRKRKQLAAATWRYSFRIRTQKKKALKESILQRKLFRGWYDTAQSTNPATSTGVRSHAPGPPWPLHRYPAGDHGPKQTGGLLLKLGRPVRVELSGCAEVADAE